MFPSSELTGAYVLDNGSSNDVAKMMIESGRQKEPFYLFDMDEAYRRIVYFKESMPRVNICYGEWIIVGLKLKNYASSKFCVWMECCVTFEEKIIYYFVRLFIKATE